MYRQSALVIDSESAGMRHDTAVATHTFLVICTFGAGFGSFFAISIYLIAVLRCFINFAYIVSFVKIRAHINLQKIIFKGRLLYLMYTLYNVQIYLSIIFSYIIST